jgi:hypothetical protein
MQVKMHEQNYIMFFFFLVERDEGCVTTDGNYDETLKILLPNNSI